MYETHAFTSSHFWKITTRSLLELPVPCVLHSFVKWTTCSPDLHLNISVNKNELTIQAINNSKEEVHQNLDQRLSSSSAFLPSLQILRCRTFQHTVQQNQTTSTCLWLYGRISSIASISNFELFKNICQTANMNEKCTELQHRRQQTLCNFTYNWYWNDPACFFWA